MVGLLNPDGCQVLGGHPRERGEVVAGFYEQPRVLLHLKVGQPRVYYVRVLKDQRLNNLLLSEEDLLYLDDFKKSGKVMALVDRDECKVGRARLSVFRLLNLLFATQHGKQAM